MPRFNSSVWQNAHFYGFRCNTGWAVLKAMTALEILFCTRGRKVSYNWFLHENEKMHNIKNNSRYKVNFLGNVKFFKLNFKIGQSLWPILLLFYNWLLVVENLFLAVLQRRNIHSHHECSSVSANDKEREQYFPDLQRRCYWIEKASCYETILWTSHEFNQSWDL